MGSEHIAVRCCAPTCESGATFIAHKNAQTHLARLKDRDVSNAAKKLADKGWCLIDDAMRAVRLPKYEGLVCASGR